MIVAKRQSAFTLVELVVVITITVLIAGATAGMLRSSSAVRERVNRQMELQTQARQAAETIASALRNACPAGDNDWTLEGADGWNDDRPADRLKFFTILPGFVRRGMPESDVKECEFFLAQPDARPLPVLMRRLDPTRNEPPDDGGVVEVIADNVIALDVAYLDGTQWVDDWPVDRKGWPAAIRLHLAVMADEAGERVCTAERILRFPIRQSQETSPGL